MKVKDRMTTTVITVEMETSMTEAFRLMKENDIRRLPVLEKGKVAGIITLTDLNQASPSSATSLSIHELNYLLAKTKIKDIIPKKQKLITVSPEAYIETAAKLMRQNTVSGLPVTENDKLVGIITESDIFDAFIDLLGFRDNGSRITVEAKDSPGSMAEIADIFKSFGVNITHIAVYGGEGVRDIVIRTAAVETSGLEKMLEERGYKIKHVLKNYK